MPRGHPRPDATSTVGISDVAHADARCPFPTSASLLSRAASCSGGCGCRLRVHTSLPYCTRRGRASNPSWAPFFFPPSWVSSLDSRGDLGPFLDTGISARPTTVARCHHLLLNHRQSSPRPTLPPSLSLTLSLLSLSLAGGLKGTSTVQYGTVLVRQLVLPSRWSEWGSAR